MTLRTALVIDGDASGAMQATGQAAAGLGQVEAAAARSAREAERAMALVQRQAARQASQLRQNLIYQLNDVGVSLASGMNPFLVAMQQGSQIATGPGGLGAAIKETGNLAVGLATKFWPIGAAVAAVTAGIAGLQHEINRTGEGIDVSFGDTALAVLQTFGDYIWDVIGPAVTAIATWFEDSVWPIIVQGASDTVNFLVRGWMGFLAELELIGTSITHIFDDTWVVIQNGAVAFLQELTNTVMLGVNAMRQAVGEKPIDIRLDFMMAEGKGGWSAEALDKFNQRKAQINGTDYAGEFFGDVADRARQNAQNRLAEDARTKKTKAETDKLTSAVNAQRTAWDELGDAGANAFDRLTESVLSGGKDILGTIQSIAGDFAKMAFQMAITNPLENLFFGGNAATFGGSNAIGAGGGILSAFMGLGGIGGLKSSPGLGGLTGTVRSYAGGGFTGRGPRSGGVDGLGGSLAIVHPDETVVDHTAGGRGGMRPVFNFFNAPNQPETRPNASGGFDFIFAEIDRRLSNGTMGKGYAARHGLRPTTRRT